MTKSAHRIVVVGIGNPERGDDAAGRAVVRRLQGLLPPCIAIREHDGEPASLIARFENADAAYLIDACRSGASAGTVRRFDVSRKSLSQVAFDLSSHSLGLAEAIELARVLGQLPPRCIVYAIEAASLEFGDALSPAVAEGVDQVVARLARELSGEICQEGESHA